MSLKKILVGTFALLALMWTGGELLLISDAQTGGRGAPSLSGASTEVNRSSAAVRATASAPMSETKRPLAISDEVVLPPLESTKAREQTSAAAQGGEATIATTLTVDGKSYLHQLREKSSVADLLKTAEAAGEITYSGKEYSGLGSLIVGINGKDNNANKNNLYWIYSVNGKKATVGVSEYVLLAGDVVSWSYEASI